MTRFSLFLPSIHEGRFIPMGALTPAHIFPPAERAEELGYDGIWIGEFMESQADVTAQFTEPPSYYAPLATLAMLAARTSRVRLPTGADCCNAGRTQQPHGRDETAGARSKQRRDQLRLGLWGWQQHHILEAVFKATARALRQAVEPDPRSPDVPSTKGVL